MPQTSEASSTLPPSPPTAAGDAPGRPPRIIALINQKGGVGKTTTTANLGAALAAIGQRVLLIDLDPQAHLTLHFGVDPDATEKNVYDLLTDPQVAAGQVVQTVRERVALLPAQVNLAGVESELAALAQQGRGQHVLRDKCRDLIAPGGKPAFDFVLLDCPPSLGLLTVNALSLASEVFVPMQCHFLALQGLSKLLETIGMVKESINPGLLVTGIILCMYEGQTVLAGEVVGDLTAFFDAARDMDVPWRQARILGPPVRRNIKLAECPSHGKTIFDYEPTCAGALDYKALAQTVAAQSVGR